MSRREHSKKAGNQHLGTKAVRTSHEVPSDKVLSDKRPS